MDIQLVNALLRSLPPESSAAVVRASRLVRLRKNRTISEEGEFSTHAYFPQSGLVSMVMETAAGGQVEVGMIGVEGVVGVGSLLGPARNVTRCVLQMDTTAFEIPLETLAILMEEDRFLRARLFEFIQVYLYGIERVAGCNRVHLAPERLVRWILMAQTYARAGQLPFTHDFLAQMVAVQRTTVSAALNSLRAEGLLDHGWGTVTIHNQPGLQNKACSCFQVLKNLHDNLYRDDADAAAPSKETVGLVSKPADDLASVFGKR